MYVEGNFRQYKIRPNMFFIKIGCSIKITGTFFGLFAIQGNIHREHKMFGIEFYGTDSSQEEL